MKAKYYWIKERCNPQLGTYYVPCGNLPVKKAKRMESSLYGCNTMLRFESEEAYNVELDRLKSAGERVHWDNVKPTGGEIK